MSPGRRRLVVVLTAAAASVLAGVVLLGGDGGYALRVELDDAAGLREDFVVKVGGVPVGKVERVELGRGDRAVAELRIDEAAAPVGRDAKAAVRPSNLLGEKYVDLDPGDASRPAPSGMLIPRARTATPTELDDLLAVLDTDTRLALGIFLEEQGRALGGRGDDLASTLVRLPPALDETRELVAGLARENRTLGRLIEESDRILASVAVERDSLGRLVEDAGGALDALASRRTQLGDTIRRAPATVAQLRRSLIELERAAVPLGPAARGLRTTAAPLTELLREVPAFTEAARPALRTARAVAPALERLGREATPTVRRLRPMTSQLARYTRELEPVTALLDEGIADMLGLMQGWARATRNRDAAGHVFRADFVMGGDTRNRLRDYIETEPAATGERSASTRRAKRDAPGTSEVPAPRPGQRADGAPEPAPPEVSPLDDSATSRLLDFLLGP